MSSTQFFCNEFGIKHFTTTPYTPQQNGVVERRNQTVIEMARCMLKSKDVPAEFWGEAVSTAVYILNRSHTKCLNGVTPFEMWYGRKPSVKHLRVFGCLAHVKVNTPAIRKLSDRSVQMILLGYEDGTKGYRVYDPIEKKLHVSRDVIFEEGKGWNWSLSQNDSAQPDYFTVRHQFTVHEPATEFQFQNPDAESSGGSSPMP